jgi:hypothetical protein
MPAGSTSRLLLKNEDGRRLHVLTLMSGSPCLCMLLTCLILVFPFALGRGEEDFGTPFSTPSNLTFCLLQQRKNYCKTFSTCLPACCLPRTPHRSTPRAYAYGRRQREDRVCKKKGGALLGTA